MKERTNKKVLQSRDIKIEGMESEPGTPRPGPRTGADLVLTDAQFLKLYATPAELTAFRASVEARRERITLKGMIELPGGMKIKGDSILATCSHCRRWAWVGAGHENDPCLSCNWRAMKGGGMMRAATKAEVKDWYAKEEARLAKIKADAPRRAAELAAYNRRLREDMGPGRKPFQGER
jgi:hypothetical protein